MMNEMLFKRDSDTKQKIKKASVIKRMETTGAIEAPEARTETTSQPVDSDLRKNKKTIEISFKTKVPNIIQKYNLKMT